MICYLARLRSNINIPSILSNPQNNTDKIDYYFRKASRLSPTHSAINLTFDLSRVDNGLIGPNNPTNYFFLNLALKKITRNKTTQFSTPNKSGVDRIALIIADHYVNHDFFGLMFDLDFDPNLQSPPREGCAIFLGPILKYRNRINRPPEINKDEIDREVLFTSIHELGHVFNLWHFDENVPPTFMSRSIARRPCGRKEAFFFSNSHSNYLKLSSSIPYAKPGGSPFNFRGSYGPSNTSSPMNKISTGSPLDLKIDMSQKEFWNFEPVELEISINLTSKNKRSATIPDVIDPGYEQFQILIEGPDGTRYWYRPPKYFCSNFGKIRVEKNKPFKRDISIFGQAGGYTFKTPGIHKIQAFLAPTKYTSISSNQLEVNILGYNFGDNEFTRAHDFLTTSKYARILYHRNGYPWKDDFNALSDFAASVKSHDLKSNINYALGRFLCQSGRGKSRQIRRKFYADARRSFQNVIDFKNSSPRRIHHSINNLDYMKQDY